VIKIADYTLVATVRLQSALFTLANIPAESIDQFIDEANTTINAELGRTTDLTAAEVAASNTEATANALVALKCTGYSNALYTNISAQMADANMFSHRYEIELEALKKLLGRAYESKPSVVSSEDL